MSIYTVCPLPRCSIPARARVIGITARAPIPHDTKTQRVKVLDVWTVNILSQEGRPPYKVALVEPSPASPFTLAYTVEIERLTAVQAYIVVEEN